MLLLTVSLINVLLFFFLLFPLLLVVEGPTSIEASIAVPSGICHPIPSKSARSRIQMEYTIALGNLITEF